MPRVTSVLTTFSIMMWKKRAVQISITSHSSTSAASPQNSARTNGVNVCNVEAHFVYYAFFSLRGWVKLASAARGIQDAGFTLPPREHFALPSTEPVHEQTV